jgi:hypothetical protein
MYIHEEVRSHRIRFHSEEIVVRFMTKYLDISLKRSHTYCYFVVNQLIVPLATACQILSQF